jgi:predicted dehydrogenase
MVQTLKAGVAGAGVFGGYHAKKYAQLDGVTLTAVFDLDRDRAQVLAAPLGAEAFDDYGAFLHAVDVVTVATPAVAHAAPALAALLAGKHAYVEKPLAVTASDAAELVAAAEAGNLVLAVGHQERVVFTAMGLFDMPDAPLRLEAVRRGPPSPRNLDVSTALDLMVHDMDLGLALARAQLNKVTATGSADTLVAEAIFSDGFTARFEASRVAPERHRTMKLVYPTGEVEIDFLSRAFRNTTGFPLLEDFAETPAGRDPLGASVQAFLDAVSGKAPRPAVTGVEAQAALNMALAADLAAGVESASPEV